MRKNYRSTGFAEDQGSRYGFQVREGAVRKAALGAKHFLRGLPALPSFWQHMESVALCCEPWYR